jgi:hypothetical protein
MLTVSVRLKSNEVRSSSAVRNFIEKSTDNIQCVHIPIRSNHVVIIYITKRNQTLKLACKPTKVSLRRKTVQTAVGSDIGLPYNASGGRMTTSGWESACL